MAGLANFNKMKKEVGRVADKVKVSVFWDIENVRPAKNASVLEVVGKIRKKFVDGGLEAGFIVVCDVRKEPKELVDKLTEAQVQVQHVSGDKKNTSDEVLRQEMRRFVDMSSAPGKIVLISGAFFLFAPCLFQVTVISQQIFTASGTGKALRSFSSTTTRPSLPLFNVPTQLCLSTS